MILYRRVVWEDRLYNTWWLFGRILVLWWLVSEDEFDGDAYDGNTEGL